TGVTLGAAHRTTDPPSPAAPEGAPVEPGTTASGSAAAPTPGSTSDSPGPSAPPCPGDEEPAEDCGKPTEEQRAAVSEAVATFALRFYQRMAEAARPEANLLFSPITVAMGLSHLLLGARGETRERLAAVLAYPPGLRCVHSALRLLSTAPGLFSATQIFHHPDLHLRARFLNESWHFYNTRPWALSGNESLDLQRINAWVREASRGLLPKLLSTLPPEPRLVLVSAVHLQGTAPGWDWHRDRAGPRLSCARAVAQEGHGAAGVSPEEAMGMLHGLEQLCSGARLRAGLGQPGGEKAPEEETLEQLQRLKGLQETWRGALDRDGGARTAQGTQPHKRKTEKKKKKKALPWEGAEVLAQGAQRSCGCPIPGSVQGQVGHRGLEHPAPVGGVPAHGRGWSWRSFKAPSSPNHSMALCMCLGSGEGLIPWLPPGSRWAYFHS
uniref:Serpin domain-containing protein n=1 Tax=Amazona collaria TaxID=241587 RepID=A0A8B9IZ95_9PSIT